MENIQLNRIAKNQEKIKYTEKAFISIILSSFTFSHLLIPLYQPINSQNIPSRYVFLIFINTCTIKSCYSIGFSYLLLYFHFFFFHFYTNISTHEREKKKQFVFFLSFFFIRLTSLNTGHCCWESFGWTNERMNEWFNE